MCVIDDETKEIAFAVTQKGKAKVRDDGIIEIEGIDSSKLP